MPKKTRKKLKGSRRTRRGGAAAVDEPFAGAAAVDAPFAGANYLLAVPKRFSDEDIQDAFTQQFDNADLFDNNIQTIPTQEGRYRDSYTDNIKIVNIRIVPNILEQNPKLNSMLQELKPLVRVDLLNPRTIQLQKDGHRWVKTPLTGIVFRSDYATTEDKMFIRLYNQETFYPPSTLPESLSERGSAM